MRAMGRQEQGNRRARSAPFKSIVRFARRWPWQQQRMVSDGHQRSQKL